MHSASHAGRNQRAHPCLGDVAVDGDAAGVSEADLNEVGGDMALAEALDAGACPRADAAPGNGHVQLRPSVHAGESTGRWPPVGVGSRQGARVMNDRLNAVEGRCVAGTDLAGEFLAVRAVADVCHGPESTKWPRHSLIEVRTSILLQAGVLHFHGFMWRNIRPNP